MSALLEVEGVSKRFRQGLWPWQPADGPPALDRVSFALAEGSTLACVGQSGSGKSTLARLVLRLIDPDHGSIRYRGQDLLGLPAAGLRRLRRELQLVFQDPLLSLNPKRTIGQNLARPLANFRTPRRRIEARIAELLDLVALDRSLAGRYPNELSGGQCQRVAIARALALEPRLLVLDEPVSALDVSVQAQILDLLLQLQARLGLTYLFITHDLRVVPYVAQEVIVMARGRIVDYGTPEAVWQAPRHAHTRRLKAAVLSLARPPDWDALARDLALKDDGPPPLSAHALLQEGGSR
jgi:peptide/nickel transport system ATP-binding protein/oligopeptide transport system ATP-binding protein